MKNSLHSFSNTLKDNILVNIISINDLADKTGIPQDKIQQFCDGSLMPALDELIAISNITDISIDELLGRGTFSQKPMFHQVFEEDFTYLSGFMRVVRKFGKKRALYDPLLDKEWTYDELNADANRLAHALLNDGAKKGDILLYQLPNCPEFIFSYLAPQKFGMITSPANFNFSAGETAVCIDVSKPHIYIYDSSIKDVAVKAIEMCKNKPATCIMVGEGDVPKGHISFEDYVAGQPADNPQTGFVPHIYDEVMRLYTSGTTGQPKGVPILQANEVLTAHDILMHFPMNSNDITMNMTPWFHRGGIHSGGPGPTFFCGGEVIILRAFQPQLCLKYAEEYKITFLIGVPAIIKLLARAQVRYGADLSALKGVVTMGSPFERADCIKIHSTLTENLYNGYGTTETFWNTFLRPYDLPKMSGTAGRSCTDDEVRVVKVYEDRRAEPDDIAKMDNCDIGEVIIRTPKSSYSYCDNPAEEEKKFYKGWVYTGDLGTWDEEQYVTIAGRKDDMIISGGENIYPPIIEEVLNQHPKVMSSAVTGIPDSTRGEAVVAYIVPEDDSLTVEELAAYCLDSAMLSAYKRPRFYRFVKELPMTATGKLQHYIVKEMATEDREQGLLKLGVAK